MSAALVKFVPRGAVEPAARIEQFIRLARELTVLIPSKDWDLPSWSVGGSFVTKGENIAHRHLHYYRIGSRAKKDGTVAGIVLAAAYIDFAKAYCRYTYAASPGHFAGQANQLNALRFIEAAFRSLGLSPRIQDCNPTVLNTAVMLARQGTGTGGGVGAAKHYDFAVRIERVHRFCYEHRFYNAPFQWRHGVRRPIPVTQQLGDGARAWRENRLPSPEAYAALADIFRNAETLADRLMSAVCAICCAVPIRAHEVLQLRDDCEVRTAVRVKRSDPSDVHQEEGEAYGIRVWPGKNNPPQVKWVPTVMSSVVKEAVQRLRDLCRPGRELAAWYEAHPDKLWLPAHINRPSQTDWISVADLRAIVGRIALHAWLNDKPQIQQRLDAKGSRQVRFGDVERVLLDLLPKGFPWFNGDRGQPYSRTLIVVRRREIHATRATCPCLMCQCTVSNFMQWLSGSGRTVPSVFTRWGFTERDGSPIQITTHCFRHWLNTVAQFRGMSELDIAKWSGRQPAQNRAYNHVTAEERLSQIRAAIEEKGGDGPLFEAAGTECFNRPVSREEFLKAQIGSAHVTDYGICIHEYSLLPCQAHGDCLGCSENVFVKGDQTHRESIEARLNLAIRQLAEAQRAEEEGVTGADRWTQDHLRKIGKMRTIVAIHLDRSIADGTIVNPGATRQDDEIAMAVRDRKVRDGQATIDFDGDAADSLKTMWGD